MSAPDLLPNLLPPEGATLVSPAQIAKRASEARALVVAGLAGSAAARVAAEVLRQGTRVLLVGADQDAAQQLWDDSGYFADAGCTRALLLAPDTPPHAAVNPDRKAAMARLTALAALAAPEPPALLVTDAAALVRRWIPRPALRRATARIAVETELDRDQLIATLVEAGYLRVPLCEDPGTFAVRGALCDLWPTGADKPYRVELYGDLVVRIERFDPETQQTEPGAAQPEIVVPPARETGLDAERDVSAAMDTLIERFDYATTKANQLKDDVVRGRAFFGADAYLPAHYPQLESLFEQIDGEARVIVLEDGAASMLAALAEIERAEKACQEVGAAPHYPTEAFLLDREALSRGLDQHPVISLVVSAREGQLDDPNDLERFSTRAPKAPALDLACHDHAELAARTRAEKHSPLSPLIRRLKHYREHGLAVQLVARTEVQGERLRGLLSHRGITLGTDPEALAELRIGSLARGLVMPGESRAFICEHEIFGGRAHTTKKKPTSKANQAFSIDMRSLRTGDLVVHVEHGVGRYLGLTQRTVAGALIDLLTVEYAGGDKLYLPVYRLNQIQKYAGGDNSSPKLDRLGGQSFAKTKARAKGAAREMADELLRLYAERAALQGPELPAIDDDYRVFEASFPFEETADQARAIDDVQGDLDKTTPMDRLVCGDVGFGKTEVALRAAFRVASAGKQVAILCPTTVLAQQHYRTFLARMEDSGLEIGVLSRFSSKREQSELLRRLKEGRCDVVVGTHRLLSKDVHFRDLGLLVVDEEQRFGVAHKERIKQLRKNVHILTLSATPIPRTLQMAVSGVRELSLITTPPSDRRAVRTLVTRFDEGVIADAISREISRGGQVFFVHPHIEGLYERAHRLQTLVPNARIAVAHGQMAGQKQKTTQKDGAPEKVQSESALERVMVDFVDGHYDVLVTTAIVESGLDIPRANTILIDRADRFGLAQLYQLRGRVGRAKERAYCYLIVPPQEAMTDEARARLEVLERHTELGSGFRVASLDLELRGAGDLLGADQSGNLASVGFELFVQMLADSVRELRGEVVVHEVDPEISFDISALLPDDYVDDIGLRLSAYQRLANAGSASEVHSLAIELENRFGPPPAEAQRYFTLMELKTQLRELRVLGCEANGARVTLHLRHDTPLDPVRISQWVKKPKSPVKLTPDMRLSRRFDPPLADGIAATARLLDELREFRNRD